MKNLHPLMLCLLLGACAAPPPASTPIHSPAAAGTSGKAVQPLEAEEEEEYELVALIPDPIEPVNRGFFWLNHGLYFAVFRPISKGYRFIVPKLLREGIKNVFSNVRYPVRFTNDLLQARFGDAGLETTKFLLNTTAGVGGLLRFSDKFPALAELPDADTGQTLARWGVPHGLYIVLPVLGPSSLRETVGLAGDMALNPITWTGFIFGGGFFWGGPAWTSAISGAQAMSDLPERMDTYDAATANALEKYISARTAWAQYREAKTRRAKQRSEIGRSPAGNQPDN